MQGSTSAARAGLLWGHGGAADELPATLRGLGETPTPSQGPLVQGVGRCPSTEDKPTVPRCGWDQAVRRPRMGLSPGPGLDLIQYQTQSGTEPWTRIRAGSGPDPDWV